MKSIAGHSAHERKEFSAVRLGGPRRALLCMCAAWCALGLSACTESEPPAPRTNTSPTTSPARGSIHFTDITRDTGIDFITTCGDLPARGILEVNGGGLGLFDYDRDGDLDLFIANGAKMSDVEHGPGSRLFRNDGALKFTDVTNAAKIDVKRFANGVAVGDVDGDGFEDLFIACFGPDILLRNQGDGTFSDFSQASGVANENSWGTSAAFGDLDNDGDLDLYVANYLEFDPKNPPPRTTYKGVPVMAGPHGLKPQHDFLYVNNGDGTFREAAKEMGAQPPQPAFGLNVVILDFDNDGWQDICVANDSMPDFYFRNLGFATEITEKSSGSGLDRMPTATAPSPSSVPAVISVVNSPDGAPRFEEIGVISGIASNGDGGNQASMGVAIADVDDNGFADKFITVFSSDTNTLHLNVNGTLFEDRSTAYGLGMISRPYLGWACGFFDFDLDGDEDLLMFNGHVYPEATMQTMDSDFEQTPLLFERDGRKFKRVDAAQAGSWLAEMHRDRSAVFGDLDGDGDIDVIVNELNGPIRVLRNDAISPSLQGGGRGVGDAHEPEPAHWLEVELRDDRPGARNRSALGARIELHSGDRMMRRWLFSGGGFQSSSPLIAHFGLDAQSGPITLAIRWPDGFEQTIQYAKPNQRLVVRREASPS